MYNNRATEIYLGCANNRNPDENYIRNSKKNICKTEMGAIMRTSQSDRCR